MTSHRLSVADRSNVGEADWRAQAVLKRRYYAEVWPESEPASIDRVAERVKRAGIPTEGRFWVAWHAAGHEVGWAHLAPHWPDCTRASIGVYVSPESRRQGFGLQLLKPIIEHAAARGIRRFHASTTSCLPAGEQLVARCGGRTMRTVLHLSISESFLRRENDDRQSRVARQGGGDGDDVEISLVRGTYDDRLLPSVAALRQRVSAVYGANWPADPVEQVKSLRFEDRSLEAAGLERWTICAVTPSGEAVGVAVFLWDPAEPGALQQMGMAVAESQRERGLASRLRAYQLRLFDELPSVRFVRTAVLATDPMRVPSEIRHHSETHWELPLAGFEWLR
jgi:GNAT superfamily N-acetyltransferase